MSSLTFPAAQGPAAAESREAFIEQEFHAGRDRLPAQPASGASTRASAFSVVEFWREAGPSLWFAKDKEFDRRFRERLLSTHEAAARGDLDGWLATATGALALILLLDQFPRNAFRGTPRMYATDAKARATAAAAIDAGHDQAVPKDLRLFIYLPFGHSEDPADQERSVALARGARRAGPVAREAAPRHHPPLRPLSASQSDPRTRDDRGRAALSRRGRLRGVAISAPADRAWTDAARHEKMPRARRTSREPVRCLRP